MAIRAGAANNRVAQGSTVVLVSGGVESAALLRCALWMQISLLQPARQGGRPCLLKQASPASRVCDVARILHTCLLAACWGLEGWLAACSPAAGQQLSQVSSAPLSCLQLLQALGPCNHAAAPLHLVWPEKPVSERGRGDVGCGGVSSRAASTRQLQRGCRQGGGQRCSEQALSPHTAAAHPRAGRRRRARRRRCASTWGWS